MAPNLILFAIPGFFLLMGLEALYCRRKRLPYYQLQDTVTDLGLGISQQLGFLFMIALNLVPYTYLYEHWRVTTLPEGAAWVWVGAFLLYDFCYYWAHRMSHEVNLLWAGHAPHHQSEEYNLSVALRQGLFQNPLTFYFFFPMALLGVSPGVFAICAQISLLYQFLIHTRAVGQLGALEWVFNTPSHHRVHHGRNPRYLDRNHAGTFIVFDRLFGTFTREDEEPVYGTVEPLRSWNPLWGQVYYLVYLWKQARASGNPLDLLRIWFMRAGWTPLKGHAPPPPNRRWEGPVERYQPVVPRGANRYALVQFGVALLGSVALLVAAPKMPLPGQLAAVAVLFMSLVAVGNLFEGKRAVRWLEPVRYALGSLLMLWLAGGWGGLGVLLLGAVSVVWLFLRWEGWWSPAGAQLA